MSRGRLIALSPSILTLRITISLSLTLLSCCRAGSALKPLPLKDPLGSPTAEADKRALRDPFPVSSRDPLGSPTEESVRRALGGLPGVPHRDPLGSPSTEEGERRALRGPTAVHHRDPLGSPTTEEGERRALRGPTAVHHRDPLGSPAEEGERRALRGRAVVHHGRALRKRSRGGPRRAAVDPFVRRSGRQLVLNGTAFYANGFNAYWLMYIASIPEQRPYVAKVLSQARAMGLTVCRTWAFYDGDGWHSLQKSPGKFDESVFQSLDYVVATAGTMGIRLHMALTNNWHDYGGREQYVNWSRKAGSTVAQDDSAFFRDPLCRTYYKNFVKAVLTRKNTITGKVYRDDPTILGWDLINEPRVTSDPSGDVLQAWIVEMAAYVKSLDSNHLLSIGSEGFYGPSSPLRQKFNAESYMAAQGTDFIRNHQAPGIDLATIHVYASSRYSVSSWSDRLQYYQSYIQAHINDCNSVLKMPLLVEEFGPEGTSSPFGTLDKRNQVYNSTYSIMLASAKSQGAGAVALLWHLLVDELQSWDDGHAVIVSKQPSVVKLITTQSQQLLGAV